MADDATPLETDILAENKAAYGHLAEHAKEKLEPATATASQLQAFRRIFQYTVLGGGKLPEHARDLTIEEIADLITDQDEALFATARPSGPDQPRPAA